MCGFAAVRGVGVSCGNSLWGFPGETPWGGWCGGRPPQSGGQSPAGQLPRRAGRARAAFSPSPTRVAARVASRNVPLRGRAGRWRGKGAVGGAPPQSGRQGRPASSPAEPGEREIAPRMCGCAAERGVGVSCGNSLRGFPGGGLPAGFLPLPRSGGGGAERSASVTEGEGGGCGGGPPQSGGQSPAGQLPRGAGRARSRVGQR